MFKRCSERVRILWRSKTEISLLPFEFGILNKRIEENRWETSFNLKVSKLRTDYNSWKKPHIRSQKYWFIVSIVKGYLKKQQSFLLRKSWVIGYYGRKNYFYLIFTDWDTICGLQIGNLIERLSCCMDMEVCML